MFSKLARKYKVASPLESSTSAATTSSTPFSTPASPFKGPVVPMTSSTHAMSPFGSTGSSMSIGAPSPSPFISSAAPSSSPFSASAAQASSLPFGKPATGASPFVSSSFPFGPPSTSQMSPFGQPAAPQPATAPSPSTTLIGGREPREVLVAFYQKYNPNRLGEVDKVLVKYKGNEDVMFRNLAKKYNLDPSMFGLPPSPRAPASFGQPSTPSVGFGQGSQPFGGSSTPGFGQPSSLGASSTFGSPSPAFGSPSAIGGGQPSTFGSLSQPGTQQTMPFGGAMQQTGGFGSLSSSSTVGFGGGAAFGGGTPPNPFGAPRR